MRIQRVILVVGLSACGTTRGDQPLIDSGDGDGGGGDDGGTGGGSTDVNKSGTRIKMKVLNTPDGAKQFAGFVDTARNNEECSFQTASDGMTRCLPAGLATYSFQNDFADANCTVRVGGAATGCALPAYVTFAQPTPAACPTAYATSIHTTGAAYTARYTKNGTTCLGPTVSAGLTYYALGAEIPTTSFQSASIAIE